MDRLNLKVKRPRSSNPLGLALVLSALTLQPDTALAERSIEDYSIFASVGGGYTHINPDEGNETSKNGYHLRLSAFGELASTNWVYQAGGGLFYNRIYSDGEKEYPGSTAGTVKRQKNLRIETRAGEGEIGARYKLTGPYEIGLIVRALFGTSLSFSQDKDESTKIFAGPHAVYRMGQSSDWLRRIDLSLTTDFNVPHRRVYLLTAGFAIGKTFKRAPEELPPAPLPSPAPAPAAVTEDRYEEILADKVINFPSGSSEVQGAALPFLKDLGQFLKANPNLWKQIDVEGHTDANGKLAYNMKLSKDRASAVRKVLLGEGADSTKIKSEGFGPTRPLVKEDSAEARATNRRVVMAFSVNGREERNALSSKIQELRKKYFNE
jgi:outer membrane protein OmpA-like peptidoglycan-associated protein